MSLMLLFGVNTAGMLKVTQDYDSMSFNTAISQLMQFTNHLYTLDTVPKEALESLVTCIFTSSSFAH